MAQVKVVADEITESVPIFAAEEPVRWVANRIEKLDSQGVNPSTVETYPKTCYPTKRVR